MDMAEGDALCCCFELISPMHDVFVSACTQTRARLCGTPTSAPPPTATERPPPPARPSSQQGPTPSGGRLLRCSRGNSCCQGHAWGPSLQVSCAAHRFVKPLMRHASSGSDRFDRFAMLLIKWRVDFTSSAETIGCSNSCFRCPLRTAVFLSHCFADAHVVCPVRTFGISNGLPHIDRQLSCLCGLFDHVHDAAAVFLAPLGDSSMPVAAKHRVRINVGA